MEAFGIDVVRTNHSGQKKYLSDPIIPKKDQTAMLAPYCPSNKWGTCIPLWPIYESRSVSPLETRKNLKNW
jgi:hypothetical protein